MESQQKFLKVTGLLLLVYILPRLIHPRQLEYQWRKLKIQLSKLVNRRNQEDEPSDSEE